MLILKLCYKVLEAIKLYLPIQIIIKNVKFKLHLTSQKLLPETAFKKGMTAEVYRRLILHGRFVYLGIAHAVWSVGKIVVSTGIINYIRETADTKTRFQTSKEQINCLIITNNSSAYYKL